MSFKQFVSTAGALALGAINFSAQAQDEAALPPPYAGEVDFATDIVPILQESCISCHGAEVIKSRLRLDSLAAILEGGIEGPSIIIGDSANSLLVQVCAGTSPLFDLMPPEGDGDPLTDEQIGKLRTWIDTGAVWPEDIVLAADAGAPDFETEAKAVGLPDSWRVEATNQTGPLAAWAQLTELTGPEGEVAFGVTSINHDDSSQLNLLWTDARKLKDGMVEVMVKANAGEKDQGGGIIWRVKDKQNYYLARYNPLQQNFRVYKMIEGQVEALASVDVEGDKEGWNTIRIEQDGDAITAYFNGEEVAAVTDDGLTEAGGLGYWTKGDAVSAFAGSKLEAKD